MPTPLEYPKVTVNGAPYQIRFGLGAWHQLNRAGVTSESMREAFGGGRSLSMTLTLAAAGLGTFNAAGDWQSVDITATQLADRLADGELKVIAEAVGVALKVGKSAPAAETEAQPAQSSGLKVA